MKKIPDIIKITCWGDSLTEGMAMPEDKTYPAQLNKMLGDGYQVLNGGDGGENSFTISARQGARDLYAAKDIIFESGVMSVDIGTDGDGLDFASKDGAQRLKMLGWLGHQIDMTDIVIDGNDYKLKFKNGGYDWSHRNNEFILTRSEGIDTKITICKGTPIYLSGRESSDIQIYYAGCNNKPPYNTSEAIISDIKAMISFHGSDKYLVIIPHWSDAHDSAFVEEFGRRAINLRMASIKYGLEHEKLPKTDDDAELMARGSMPVSLRYKNDKNEVHLNENGYHFFAHIIYERGAELGLW